jgi:hypothetical protein
MKTAFLKIAFSTLILASTGQAAAAATIKVKAKEGATVTLQGLGSCKTVNGNYFCSKPKLLGSKKVKDGFASFTFNGKFQRYCALSNGRGGCGTGGTIVIK